MHTQIKTQQGAVLVISIVVLAVITLIAVSELSKAGDQTRMTANSQQFNQTFHAAESAMSHAMKMISEQSSSSEANMAAMGSAMTADEGVAISVDNDDLSDDNMDVSVSYRTETVNALRPGISLNASQNDFMIRKVNFTATGTAIITGSGASATITQGFTYE